MSRVLFCDNCKTISAYVDARIYTDIYLDASKLKHFYPVCRRCNHRISENNNYGNAFLPLVILRYGEDSSLNDVHADVNKADNAIKDPIPQVTVEPISGREITLELEREVYREALELIKLIVQGREVGDTEIPALSAALKVIEIWNAK